MSRVGDPPHGIEASQDHDDKEKREERREEREERREKTEDRPKEAARGPQMRPPEGDQPFSTPYRHGQGRLGASCRRPGQREYSSIGRMSRSAGGTRLVVAPHHEHTSVVRNEQPRQKRQESRERSEKKQGGSMV